MKTKQLILGVLVVGLVSLSFACETIKGAGQDLQNLGNAGSNATKPSSK